MLPIEGLLFFDFIDGGGVFCGVRSKMSSRARDFVHGVGILSLQEFSGGSRAVLVRYVYIPALVVSLAGIFCCLFDLCVVLVGGYAIWWCLLGGRSIMVLFVGIWAVVMFSFACILCVTAQICHVVLYAVCALSPQGGAGVATTGKTEGVGRMSFCQLVVEKSGWMLDPTICGGSAPPRGVSSLGDLGGLPVLGAPGFLMLGDVQPGRSAFKMHVSIDLLLKTTSKNYALRQVGGRLQAGRSDRRRRGRPGGDYKDLGVISFSFEGVLVRRAVITKKY
ncbi:unnamed protein product [Urochloa humidicola]